MSQTLRGFHPIIDPPAQEVGFEKEKRVGYDAKGVGYSATIS